MALSGATVFEVRTAGNDTNGGGFVAGAAGTDYSQQDSKNTVGSDISTTDAVADGTTTITSATANFGTSIVGNIVYFQGGTGTITAVWRQVTARASTTSITIDAAIAASTGMTMNIGGALLSPGRIGSTMTDGNWIYIKAGTYLITVATLNVAGGLFRSDVRINVEGYQATRGDLGTPPELVASGISTATLMIVTGNDSVIRNVVFDGASLTSIRGVNLGGRGYLYKVTGKNCTNNGILGLTFIVRCTATGCSTQPAISGGTFIFQSVAYANTVTGFQPNSGARIIHCLSYNNTGASSAGFKLTNSGQACSNCTAYGNGGIGFEANSLLTVMTLNNCIAEANAGYGFDVSSAIGVHLLSCATYNNTSGSVLSSGAVNLLNLGFVTGTGSFFTNAASGDFSLNNTAGAGAAARATGTPGVFPLGLTTGYLDIGAAQHADPAAGGGLLRHPGMNGGLNA